METNRSRFPAIKTCFFFRRHSYWKTSSLTKIEAVTICGAQVAGWQPTAPAYLPLPGGLVLLSLSPCRTSPAPGASQSRSHSESSPVLSACYCHCPQRAPRPPCLCPVSLLSSLLLFDGRNARPKYFRCRFCCTDLGGRSGPLADGSRYISTMNATDMNARAVRGRRKNCSSF